MRLSKCAVFSLLLGTACQASTNPLADVYVETSVSQNNSMAAPISITTTVTNIAPRAVTITTNNCPRAFRIETADGLPIALPNYFCTMELRQVLIRPGASYHFREQWDGKDANGTQLLGRYRAVGQPFLDGGRQSAPATFSILQ